MKRSPLQRKTPLRAKGAGLTRGAQLKARPRQAPTQAERARFTDLQAPGCLACRAEGHPGTPADVHHVLLGGRRRGHRFTMALCPWHHRGVPPDPLRPSEARGALGPSLALHPAAFAARYGSQEALLALQDALLGD